MVVFYRKVFEREPYEDPLIMIVRSGCVWALVAWGIYAISADAISSQYPRYLLFYVVVLLDRASAISRQASRETLWEDDYLEAMESFEQGCDTLEVPRPECMTL